VDSTVDCAKKYSIKLSVFVSGSALGDNSLRNRTADFTLPGVLFILFYFIFYFSYFIFWVYPFFRSSAGFKPKTLSWMA